MPGQPPRSTFIVEGIRLGFRIGFDYGSHTCRRSTSNMLLTRERPEVINEYTSTRV